MIIPHPSNISYIVHPSLSIYNEIQLGFNLITNTMVSIRNLTLEDDNNKIINTDTVYVNHDETDYDRLFSEYKKYILQK
jgi:pantothenate kinase-related protein Tda10